MFGAFRYNEKTKEHDHFSLTDHAASPAQEREYTRTACDLCRARKLKCNGDKDECDRCIATSNICTYTLSSGTGPGRKRLRKTSTAANTNARSSPESMSRSQSPRRPHQKGSRHGSGTATPRSSRRGTGSTEPIVTNLPTDSSLPSPTEPNSSAWSTAVSDLHALLNFTGEMEPFTGSEFDFASGFPGLAPLSQGDHSPSALQASLSDNISSLFGLQSVPGTVDSTTGLLTAPPTRTQSGQGLSSSLSSEPLNTPMTSSTSSSGQKCGCLCALLTIFEETGVQVASNKDMPTDCLFQCLQEGIQKCQAMLVCPDCDTSAKNPILLATLGNQLVVIAGEIVSRFTQCQSRDTVPTVFQFGRYSIKCADMRTRLLRDMIALHVRDLYDLLDRSKLSIGNMQGPLSLLESAKLDVTKLHELLSQNSEHGESR